MKKILSGRERFLVALQNKKPDRLPCQVHNWMYYYLKTYLGGRDQFGAYDYFGMDPVIYVDPIYKYDDRTLANWQEEKTVGEKDAQGNTPWERRVATPKGTLVETGAGNQFTGWTTEYLIKNERDFEIWNEFVPVPVAVDWSPVQNAKKLIGDRGIVRAGFFDFGQGGPWQSFASILYGIEKSIMAAMEKPDWVHHALTCMLEKKLRAIEVAGNIELDLVETGGGAGSSTVISPAMQQEFCVPYDQKQHAALHSAGTKIVYHLCGGLMPLLEIVAGNGADGLETMTPPGMGGDCDFAEATRRVGDKLFFIGGFDQNKGIEKGNPALVREIVHALHAARPQGGYICSPSDHFFFGDPQNLKAFVSAAKECVYT